MSLLEKIDITQLDKVADEIYELNHQLSQLEEKKKSLQVKMKLILGALGLEKFESSDYKVWLQNTARPVKLKVSAPALPAEYQLIKPDEAGIRKAIDAGIDLSKYAELEEAGSFVRVSAKKKQELGD
jgi:hypothetical protein